MTATQMIPAVGATVSVDFESVSIHCQVMDVKMSWGKPKLLISPRDGSGQQWVELSRVRVSRKEAQGISSVSHPRGWDAV